MKKKRVKLKGQKERRKTSFTVNVDNKASSRSWVVWSKKLNFTKSIE